MSTAIFRRSRVVTPMTRRTKMFFALISLVILAVAVESGIEAYLGGNKLLLIVPISVLAGVGMVALGLVNFENFVFTTIAIRSTLDITKPQAGNTGAAGVGNPTASGLDPAGALAVLFILVAFFWLLVADARGAQIAARVDPPCLSDPLRRRRVPQHHRLGEPDASACSRRSASPRSWSCSPCSR